MENPRRINVDELQAQTTLEEAAAKCGVTLDARGAGREVRIDCPFGCAGDHVGRREISVNVENLNKVFQCHAYSCGFKGNMMTLMHGWLTGAKPTGARLKGDEFNRVKKVLAAQHPAPGARQPSATPTVTQHSPPPELVRNIPLIDSPEEKIRELHNIDEKFVVDAMAMSPAAASYVRRHPSLTPESMPKWRVGYLPMDGGGDKRGYSLRGNVIYPVLSEEGKVLSWVARDVLYEDKEREFARLSAAERSQRDPPTKHRFPKGFHRGMELFGQHAARLEEHDYRELIRRCGIIVVEGFNDVIGLDNLGIPAVAIMSNRMTELQGDKIARWARQLANGRVTLMFDCEASGIDGAKEALWFFAQRQLDVRLAWTPWMHSGAFVGRQPESLTAEEWQSQIEPGLVQPSNSWTRR